MGLGWHLPWRSVDSLNVPTVSQSLEHQSLWHILFYEHAGNQRREDNGRWMYGALQTLSL